MRVWICCAALLGTAAAAQEDELALAYGDSATVSIATGAPQSLRRAPAVAMVITAEQIRAMGAKDLDEVLERVPGLHVARGPGAYPPLYQVRGVHSQFNPQTLMLQNGVPLTTLLVGNRGNGWGGLPVAHIARIEVMLSPGSALYGADAYSGVINVITKSAAEVKNGEAGVRAGSFGAREVWAQHTLGLGPVQGLWHLQWASEDGHRRTIEADAQSFNDRSFGSAASLAPGPVNLAREALDAHLDLAWAKWHARLNYKQRELGTGVGVSQALDPFSLYYTRRWLGDLSWQSDFGNWSAGSQLSYLHYQQRYKQPLMIFPPGVRFPTGVFPNGMQGAPETWENQWRWQGHLQWNGFSGHRLRLGLGAEDLDLYRTRERKNFLFAANGLPIPLPEVIDQSETAPFLRPQRRRVVYAYAQDDWQLARDWTLTAGLRVDRFSDFGSTTNPRLALVWDAAQDLTLKLLHGRAFRAPAFNEQYSISNPVARGNPDIRPERLRSTELALVWQVQLELQLRASLYQQKLSDIIRSTPNAVAGTGTTFNNTGDQRGHGGELSLVWQAQRGLSLEAHASLQRSRDLPTATAVGYAPEQRLYLVADWQAGANWRLGAQLNDVRRRLRAAGDTRPAIPDYRTLDLSLRWSPPQPWSLGLVLRNLTNADVREPSLAPGRIVNDLPQAPRSVSLEASWRL
ncbi:MAG: TonB-dependent receptor [Inhella sp.]